MNILPSARKLGILLVLCSAVLWSTAGLFVRMAELDIWSIVAWRSVFSLATLMIFITIRNRATRLATPRTFGWPGVISTMISVVAAIAYIASLHWTTVANVMTIYATLPFMATLMAYFWFAERVSLRFTLAGAASLCGVAITVAGAWQPGDIIGMGAAIVMTGGFAAQLVFARRYPSLDMSLMTLAAAGICCLVALPFMQLAIPTGKQLLACALYGILTTGVAYILVLMGSRLIGSGEAGFISMLDIVLGPLWVWLFFQEHVGMPTLLGATIVIAAVIWYLSTTQAYTVESISHGLLLEKQPEPGGLWLNERQNDEGRTSADAERSLAPETKG